MNDCQTKILILASEIFRMKYTPCICKCIQASFGWRNSRKKIAQNNSGLNKKEYSLGPNFTYLASCKVVG